MTRRAWLAVVRWVAVAAVGMLLAAPLLTSLFGARLVAVDGGSMAPTYAVGDLLLMTPPTGDDLTVGEPVVIGDDGSRYVHRVIERDGDRAKLRGDANEVEDPGWVTQAEVSAVVSAHLGGPAAIVVSASTRVEGRIALALVLLLLIAAPSWLQAASAEAPTRLEHAVPESGSTS